MLTCTQCGFCKAVCPTYPELRWDSNTPRGRVLLSYGILTGDLPMDDETRERIYECSTCKACEEKCPSGVNVVEIIEKAREEFLKEGRLLKSHNGILKRSTDPEIANPYGEKRHPLQVWEKTPHKSKIGVFVGCTTTYRNTSIGEATFSVLDKLGIDYTMVDERCCGSPLQRIGGKDEQVKALAQHNIDEMNKYGVETVLFSCAGCYNEFKNHYPELVDYDFEVKHISEFLDEYMKEHGIKLKHTDTPLTYHDPCHLGRHSGVYDEPRDIIARIQDVNFKEMEHNREWALCCGGGGGLRAGFPDMAEGISKRRIKEAEDVGAEVIATPCPFCVNNLSKGAEAADSSVKVKDLIEVIDELL